MADVHFPEAVYKPICDWRGRTQPLYISFMIDCVDMPQVKIINREKPDLFTRLTTYLTVALGLLTGFILLVSHGNPSLTGYSVFSSTYGAASPFIIVGLLVVIVVLYLRVTKR